MESFLEFEKPIAELERKIGELRQISDGGDVDVVDEIIRLEKKLNDLLRSTYGSLNAWQRTLVARHPQRPHFNDYIDGFIDDFTPLAGDRGFAEDEAIVGGLGRFRGQSVVVIGTEKGRDTESRIKHNFGMARPEGYRKARRLVKLAEQYQLPVLSFIDTPGAYPGMDSEGKGGTSVGGWRNYSCDGETRLRQAWSLDSRMHSVVSQCRSVDKLLEILFELKCSL